MNIKSVITFALFAILIVPVNFFSYAITVHSQTNPKDQLEILEKAIEEQIERSGQTTGPLVKQLETIQNALAGSGSSSRTETTGAPAPTKTTSSLSTKPPAASATKKKTSSLQIKTTQQPKIETSTSVPSLGPVNLPDPVNPKKQPSTKKDTKDKQVETQRRARQYIERTSLSFEPKIGIEQTEQQRRSSGTTRNKEILDALGEDRLSEDDFFKEFATQIVAALAACLAAEKAAELVKKGKEAVGKLGDKLKKKATKKAKGAAKKQAKKQVKKQLGGGGGDKGGSTDVPTEDKKLEKAVKKLQKGVTKEIKSNTKKTVEKTDELVEKECTLDAISFAVKEEAKAFLVQDLLAWVNNGFEGKPLFVSNPRRFFNAISDRVTGQIIDNSALGFLCSPFDISLDLGINLPRANTIGDSRSCTFSGVEDNINNAASGVKRKVKTASTLASLLKQSTISPKDVPTEDLARHLANPLNDYQAALAIATSKAEAERARVEAETKAGISQGTLGAPNPDCAAKFKKEGKPHLIPTECPYVQGPDYIANVERAVLNQELESINLADEVNEVLIYALQQAAGKFITTEISKGGSGRNQNLLSSGLTAVKEGSEVIRDGVDFVIDTGKNLSSFLINNNNYLRLSSAFQEFEDLKETKDQSLPEVINTFVVEVVTPLVNSIPSEEMVDDNYVATFKETNINTFVTSLPSEIELIEQYGFGDLCSGSSAGHAICIINDDIISILISLQQTIVGRLSDREFYNDPETGLRVPETVFKLDFSDSSTEVVKRRNRIITNTKELSAEGEEYVNLIDTTKPFLVKAFFEFGSRDLNTLIDGEHVALYSDSPLGTQNCPTYDGDENLDIFPLSFQNKFTPEEVATLKGVTGFDIIIDKSYYRTKCTMTDIFERENIAIETFFFEEGQNILDITDEDSDEFIGSLRYNYNNIEDFLKDINNYY